MKIDASFFSLIIWYKYYVTPINFTEKSNMIKFQPNMIYTRYVVVGCGGIGSRLVPYVLQFLQTLPHLKDMHDVHLYDHDVVEDKNLQRQNFIPPNVGHNKAEVLANRYIRGWGSNVIAHPQMFDSDAAVNMCNNNLNVIFLLCVDSAKARREIVKNIFYAIRNTTADPSKYLIIDGGNEDRYGQVMVGQPFVPEYYQPTSEELLGLEKKAFPVTKDIIASHLPLDADTYNNMQEGEAAGSCADLDQTMAINILVATYMFSIVQDLLFGNPINFRRININMSGAQTVYLTSEYYLKAEGSHHTIGSGHFLLGQRLSSSMDKTLKEMYVVFNGILDERKALESAEAA